MTNRRKESRRYVNPFAAASAKALAELDVEGRRRFIKGMVAAGVIGAATGNLLTAVGEEAEEELLRSVNRRGIDIPEKMRVIFEGILRDAQHPSGHANPPPPPDHAVERADGLLIERNVAIPLRDGVKIYADVYRPDGPLGERDLAPIVCYGPYGKHTTGRTYAESSGVRPEWVSRHAGFEAVDPVYWCPLGYAVIYPDPRGTWYSEGEMSHGGLIEALDVYDVVEWVGVQPWSNGKVGMSGVSYLAAVQYQVAPLKPPHLAAINPWEAFSDWYREFAYHGGIRETGFLPVATANINWGLTRTEHTDANVRAHPLWDRYWESKVVALEEIEVPAFVVASWSDHGLHTRGTLECFKKMRSQQKWLLCHGQKKWGHFYDPQNVRQLQTFFDHFLKGRDDTVLSWPKVRIEVRERAYSQVLRAENEWPLARQRLTKLYLDAATKSLSTSPFATESEVSYDSETGAAWFDYVFDEDTEITGHMMLRLWGVAAEHDDMDLFVAIQKIDENGEHVGMHYYANFDTGPVALGWLRASHRALDETVSTPEQPIQHHRYEEPLTPGVAVPMEIEIWPSSTLFRKGERLRVLVQGRDIYPYPDRAPGIPLALHEDLRNKGRHVLRTGGAFDSYLLMPVIPKA